MSDSDGDLDFAIFPCPTCAGVDASCMICGGISPLVACYTCHVITTSCIHSAKVATDHILAKVGIGG